VSCRSRNAVNVTRVAYRNASEGRYTDATVYARGGGKKFGRTKLGGHFVDDESRPRVLGGTPPASFVGHGHTVEE
jgi:hypothetical protein